MVEWDEAQADRYFDDATGEYVALLDGADYWTDPLKLKKQVQRLDESTDYAICFHNVYNVHEDGTKVPFPPFKNKKEHDEIDILLNFIPASVGLSAYISIVEACRSKSRPTLSFVARGGQRPLYGRLGIKGQLRRPDW